MSVTSPAANLPRDWIPGTRDLLIGGEFVSPQGERWPVYNPATEQVIATVGGASAEQVDAAVAAARAAFPGWAASARRAAIAAHPPAGRRAGRGRGPAAALDRERGRHAGIARVFLQVRMAVQQHLRWAAEAAKTDRTQHLGPWNEPVPTHERRGLEPVGVVAAITGYNYPLNLAIFKFGAALAAGCTVVLLPSPRTPLTTLFLGELIRQADLPPGVMNVITGNADVGQQLSSHPGVDRVSFTGSDAVGAMIMAQAAGDLTGVTLELGGKSPSIVLPDADVGQVAVETHLRWSRNGGQGCAALARLLVHESLYDEFLAASAPAFEQMVVGDPWDPATNIGPMIRPDHQARVRGFIDESVAAGGRKLLEVIEATAQRGWFVNPVLLGDLPARAPGPFSRRSSARWP